MKNPLHKLGQYHGAPSLIPDAPPSAEKPMSQPKHFPETRDIPVNKPATPPSAETLMQAPGKPA